MPALELTSLEDALAVLRQETEPLPVTRTSLPSLGLVLQEDVLADTDQPPFDRSAMDGYAAAGDHATYQIVGEIQPGDTPLVSLTAGQAARIFTGAQIPDGATRVLMQEHVVPTGDNTIRVRQNSREDHIRRRGEDAQAGQVLLPAGKIITPAVAAIMASVGMTRANVTPKPRVLHLATGNELVAPEETPQPSQIRDSNSTLMAGLLQAEGIPLARQERLADDLPSALAVCRDESSYDALLISGGASVGTYDFGKPLLEGLGYQIHLERLDLRPGKPLIFGTKVMGNQRQLAFVLPGNPISHFVCWHLMVRQALLAMADRQVGLATVRATLDGGLAYRPAPRLTFWPARLVGQSQKWFVRALPWQSSGDLAALGDANALIRIRCSETLIPHGRELDVVVLDPGYYDLIPKDNQYA